MYSETTEVEDTQIHMKRVVVYYQPGVEDTQGRAGKLVHSK